MNKNAEAYIRKLIRESLEEMSGFARVRNIMLGGVESINTVGIITTDNPMGEKLSTEENNKRNEVFKYKLKELNFSYVEMKGKYGNLEHPFFIPNIKKEDLIKLGTEFEQESIIFGEKLIKDNFITFKWTYIEEGIDKDIKYASLGGKSIQDKEDLYSIVKGRKFYIPFFEKSKKWNKPSIKYGFPQKEEEKIKQNQATSTSIPTSDNKFLT